MTQETSKGPNLAMDSVRVTEAVALAASRLMGSGDEQAADKAAVDSMHAALKHLGIDGTIHKGEGAEGEADKLFNGEKVGNGAGPEVDVAVMPLEGPTIVAKGEPNGLSVVALAEGGDFLNVPDLYMDKIAVGGGLPGNIVDLDADPADNLKELAKAKGAGVNDLVVCILDRPRHGELIGKVRETGARIMLIPDGDVSGVIATMWLQSGIDIYMGIGGAPQGVLSAAALACVGGQMQARLVIRNDGDRTLASDCGITDTARKYTAADMATGDITFAATGVTTGPMLSGVRYARGIAVTHSLALRSKTGTLRYIEAHHDFAHPGNIK
ncbi:MAG: class II fructose-bisphosphatase [Rhodospirillales bacterium]|nr:class II fructose-bisphosphatase [Rhodospirillales bacterium]